MVTIHEEGKQLISLPYSNYAPHAHWGGGEGTLIKTDMRIDLFKDPGFDRKEL